MEMSVNMQRRLLKLLITSKLLHSMILIHQNVDTMALFMILNQYQIKVVNVIYLVILEDINWHMETES